MAIIDTRLIYADPGQFCSVSLGRETADEMTFFEIAWLKPTIDGRDEIDRE